MISRHIKLGILILLLFVSIVQPLVSMADTPPSFFTFLDQNRFSADLEHHTILTIPSNGRYAIFVKSQVGTSLQLIDATTGPGPISGSPGQADGRIDPVLAHGQYKIITKSPQKSSSIVDISVKPFTELNKDGFPKLETLKLIETNLADIQTRSYVIDVPQKKQVMIEAAGRNLSDMILWKNGNWRVDAVPQKEIIEPRKGYPLQNLKIVKTLNPGQYVLSLYGGPSTNWTTENGKNPLYIRTGIASLPETGAQHFEMSPFGIDRFLVPGKANFFRLELPSPGNTRMFVRSFDPQTPYDKWGRNKMITKKSRLPVLEIFTYQEPEKNIVTIEGAAGQTYLLQHFNNARAHHFTGRDTYWLSTVHTGTPSDNIDATAFLIEKPHNKKRRLIKSQAIILDEKSIYKNQFNLLEKATLFVEIKKAGKYIVHASGAKAKFRIEPFLLEKPQNYSPPGFHSRSHGFDLATGFYVLTLRPESRGKGILKLSIAPDQASSNKLKVIQNQPNIRFENLNLTDDSRYTLYLNAQPRVKSGLNLRKLPIRLTQPLAIYLLPDEILQIPVHPLEKGQIQILSSKGAAIAFRKNKSKLDSIHSVEKAQYRLQIPNSTSKIIRASVLFVPERLAPSTPIPLTSLKNNTKQTFFSRLNPGEPIFFDLEEQSQKSFAVKISDPGFYRIESQGLLHVEGQIRTQIIPSIDQQIANGTGRNFLIQQYLCNGNYQVTVKTHGQTQGHLGVQLEQARLMDYGKLDIDTPQKMTLQKAQGGIVQFNIKQTDMYRLELHGLNKIIRYRLEDEEGWPIIPTNQYNAFEGKLSAGSYRLIILPLNVSTRVVINLDRITQPKTFTGHGPHPISIENIGAPIAHRWMEPNGTSPRIPDQWQFSPPAPVTSKINVSQGMKGTLYYANKPQEPPIEKAKIYATSEWIGALEPGKHILEMESIRKNHQFDYNFTIRYEELVPGQQKKIAVPGDYTISIGTTGDYILSSSGQYDLLARLFNHNNQLIAENDDGENDWNFILNQHLAKGMYHLQVSSIDQQETSAQIHLKPQTIKIEKNLILPFSTQIQDSKVHQYPLVLEKNENKVFICSAKGNRSIALTIEKKSTSHEEWKIVGQANGSEPFLLLPTSQNGPELRLKVQNMTQQTSTITISGALFFPETYDEDTFLNDGVQMTPIPDRIPRIGIFKVQLNRPGIFKLIGHDDSIQWTSIPGSSLSFLQSQQIITQTNQLWIGQQCSPNCAPIIKGIKQKLSAKKAVNLTLEKSETAVLELEDEHLDVVMAKVSCPQGQPGIATLAEEELSTAMGISPNSAITIFRPKKNSAVKIWNADPNVKRLNLRVEVKNDTIKEEDQLSFGHTRLQLPARQALLIQLPPGPKKYQLSLPPKTGFAFLKNNNFENVHWSGDEPTFLRLENDDHQLLLLAWENQLNQFNQASIHIYSKNKPHDHQQFIQTHASPAPGTLWLTIPPLPAAVDETWLHIQGNNTRTLMLDHHGHIQRGSKLKYEPESKVKITYDPGMIITWLSGPQINPWDDLNPIPPITIEKPTLLPLKGPALTLNFAPKKPALLHIESHFPIISYMKKNHASPQIQYHENGANLWSYLPNHQNDPFQVRLFSPNFNNLADEAIIGLNQIIPTGEGLGPSIRIAPSETSLFSFTIPDERQIGLGVKSESDQIFCRLLNENGEIKGQGLIQMHTLKKGTYIFSIAALDLKKSIVIQPVVLGIMAPDTGPTKEIIEQYIGP